MLHVQLPVTGCREGKRDCGNNGGMKVRDDHDNLEEEEEDVVASASSTTTASGRGGGYELQHL
jgi:hypothetical protein